MDGEEVKRWVAESGNIVFFGGAGVSTESAIPDFRSDGGRFRAEAGSYAPEDVLSRRFLEEQPELFFTLYRRHMLYPDARPNDAHLALARLERQRRLRAVITQNIDGLHQKAGSRHVIELHGSVERNYCVLCGQTYALAFVIGYPETVPRCERCGGMVRPDVVLYGEQLDPSVLSGAERSIAEADVLIVAGTSLTVFPAAGLIRAYRGGKLILINRAATRFDGLAQAVISDGVGKVMTFLTT